MSKDRIWFIKVSNCGKHILTLFEDGYVFDRKGKKLMVLQKASLQQVRNLAAEYASADSQSDEDIDISIKCNIYPTYESHNSVFYKQLTDLIFSESSIKHPPEHLNDAISEIERLRLSGKLSEMIKSMGQEAFIEHIISLFY